jgi:hypothetical protein
MMLFNDAGFFHSECHVINHAVAGTASFKTAVIYKCKEFFKCVIMLSVIILGVFILSVMSLTMQGRLQLVLLQVKVTFVKCF